MKLELKPGFAVFAALIGLICAAYAPAFFLAFALHEAGHLACAAALGGKIGRISLGFADCRIETGFSGYVPEAACAMAGPLVNLVSCAVCSKAAPVFAAVSLLLGVYNLLPIWPLDGARSLYCLLCLRSEPDRAWAVVRLCGLLLCAVLLAFSLAAGTVWKLGLWPLLAALALFARLALAAKGENGCFFP